MEPREAKDKDLILLDGWSFTEIIREDTDTFTDAGWPGCNFRVQPFALQATKETLGININITGRKCFWAGRTWKARIQVEFVGDCEPSTFWGGWIYYQD